MTDNNLATSINRIADGMETDVLQLMSGIKIRYQYYMKDEILNVAKKYLNTDQPEKIMQVLLITKADVVERGEPYDFDAVQNNIIKSLPDTFFSVPKWMRGLPIYPSQEHRRADEIRDKIIDAPFTNTDRRKLVENAESFLGIANISSPLDRAMWRLHHNVLLKDKYSDYSYAKRTTPHKSP